MPERIQRKRTKSWKMPDNTVYVGRPGKWGNPFNFSAADHCWNALAFDCRGDRRGRQEAAVKAYRQWVSDPRGRVIEMDFGVVMEGAKGSVPIGPRAKAGLAPGLAEIKAELSGKNLACWCALKDRHGIYVQCHADVLLSIANDIPMDEVIRENSRRAERETLQVLLELANS